MQWIQTLKLLSVVPGVTTFLCFGINWLMFSADATQGDTMVLDVFDAVQQTNQTVVEWVWLVDTGTAQLLRASTYSYSSSDNSFWVFHSRIRPAPKLTFEIDRVPRIHLLYDLLITG